MLVCLLLAACGPSTQDPSGAATEAATSPAPSPTALEETDGTDAPTDRSPADDATATAGACSPEEHPPVQAGSHLIGDAEPPVDYSSTPPTSGWHSSGAVDISIHGEDDPLTEPEQVTVLEADGVVITYRDLAEEDVESIEDLVRSEYAGQVAVTPYDELESGQVALTSWATLQRCDGVDLEEIRTFLAAHAGDAVKPGHS